MKKHFPPVSRKSPDLCEQQQKFITTTERKIKRKYNEQTNKD